MTVPFPGWLTEGSPSRARAERKAFCWRLPETSEESGFLPALGLYRALLDPAAPETPGATVKELLGYGDREESFQIEVEIQVL